MTAETIFLSILTIIVFAALGGTALRAMVRQLRLRNRLGPENDKAAAEHGSRSEAATDQSPASAASRLW
jgi:hypothetical protein